MALIVTPGPLPADGERAKIDDFLTSFVQGTTFTNFGAAEFSDAPIGFMISQTDAPATSVRGRGTVWFARGEGVLYKWTPEPVKSNLFSPSEAGVNTSEAQWVAISNRKEAMVKCRWGWAADEVIRMNTANSEWKFEISERVDDEPRHTLVMASTAGTDGGLNLGFAFDEARFQGHHMHIDPTMIATKAAVDGSYEVVVECGFTRCLVEGPGANDADHPSPLYHFGHGDPHYRLKSTGATAWTNVAAVLAFCCESAASSREQSLDIFKPATSTNMVKDPLATRFNG